MLIPSHLPKKKFAKGDFLLQQDESVQFAFYVLNGCLKSSFIDKTGKEHIMQFACEGWYITDMNGFFNHQPSTLLIQAIEETEVLAFDRASMAEFKDESKEDIIERTRILTRNIIATQKRLMLLLSSTGEERYLNFMQIYPSLMQRLPLKMIASYIGVTPEYLSEIRKKIASR